MSSAPLLQAEDLHVHFRLPGDRPLARPRLLRALSGVSLQLTAGRTLGVVGESGCGKSTLARALLGLQPLTRGRVQLRGREITGLSPRRLRPLRRHMQMVFQDPLAALDPRMTVGRIIAEPLQAMAPELDRRARRARVGELMERVGLRPELANRYPHEFSGGQCQRIGIARALAPEPDLLICDEPVSALDVSIQAQIVNLLLELQQEMGLAMLFIAHDLAVVRAVSHEVLVMYLGRPMEQAPAERLFRQPLHPYTRALLEAVPVPDPRVERQRPRTALPGELPSPLDPPGGCPFHTRCPAAETRCATQAPRLRSVAPRHQVACHLAD